MKSTDISWRSKIGRFKSFKFKKHENNEIMPDKLLRFMFCVVSVALLIGGIESNPGPSAKVSFKEITLDLVSEHLNNPTNKGSLNPRFKDGQWGKLSFSILGVNNEKLRVFLKNFVSIFPTEPQKYKNTNLMHISKLLSSSTADEKNSANLTQSSSIWGRVSQQLFASNTIMDRKFVSSLWAIGNEVESLDKPGDGSNHNLLPKQVTRDTLRQKRKYQKKYHENKTKEKPASVHHHTISPDPTQDQERNRETQSELITRLTEKFKKEVCHYADSTCEVCDMQIYSTPNHKFTLKVTDNIKAVFYSFDKKYQFPVSNKLTVCARCKSNLSKDPPNMPPKALVNSLYLSPVPPQIGCLSKAEVRLISQVKVFMKIFLLNKGRGQKAMKGLVVHFPQQINEVITQLPLNANNADFIVVHETGDKTSNSASLRVRPAKIYEALNWLVQHNVLYRNIQIQENIDFLEFQSISMERSQSISATVHDGANLSYLELSNGLFVLQGSFSQGHEIFLDNRGKQCTAMSASFLAHCFIEPPLTWTRQCVDDVIMVGNDYYTQIKAELNHNHDYLTADEVAGRIRAFRGAEVNLNTDNSTPAIRLHGYANRARGVDLPKLPEQIRAFISSGYKFGILTIGQYSMGICVEGDFTYYFDSHSRGKHGGKTRGGDGTSIVLKIDSDSAPSKISSLANRNCVSSSIDPKDLLNLMFTITVFNLSRGENPDPVANLSPSNSPERKIPRQNDFASESESEEDEEQDQNSVIPTLPHFHRVLESDCVIERDDVIEPHIDEIVEGEFNLRRNNGSPINERAEQYLDLLAFPNLFPHGVNGLNSFRKIVMTPLDYFQQRLMSGAKRFIGNTDFLFYALSESDKHRAKQKISVCCAQTRQGGVEGDDEENLGARDPHVYMSSIRGTSSYWKKYTGDLIAMIKSLGIPTFFITVSHDDLNSFDCINALYKAKYPGADDILPENIPYDERKDLLNDYPITAARHFSMRLSKFLALLKGNGEEIFGLSVVDYSIRVEFQSRGSPHAHCLFWLKDAPAWDTPEGIQLLEKNVSCSIKAPLSDLVLRYQKHSHTKTCFKNPNSGCRFAFPKPVTEETRILNEDEIVQNKGRFFVLKREAGEEMINYYHPVLLAILKSNIDIQPVTGAVAIAYYIAKYCGKSEPLEIRRDIRDTINRVQSSNLPAREKMFRVAMTLMRNREISAQEASFRMCHLFLRYSSRACVFLPTFRKEKRVRMVRKETIGQDSPQFCTNIIDRYMARPTHSFFESMSLFEFASWYAPEKKNSPLVEEDEDLIEFPEEAPDEVRGTRSLHKCRNSNGVEIGKVFRRRFPAVIKYPNFHPITDKESYYYSLLLLYMPFREETFCDTRLPSDVFNERHQSFRNHTHDPIIRMELAEEIDRALLRIVEFDELENENVDIENAFEAPFEDPDVNDLPSQEEAFRHIPPDRNVTETIAELYRGLNVQQKELFNTVRSKLLNNSNNFRQMVLADAGTGKSHCLKLLSLLIKNTLSENALLIAAPTGKAAFPIGGSTCHRIFGLQVQHGFIASYQKLSSRKLAELRRLYHNVQWIFIDEISMVSYENFRAIHLRLCEIFGTDGSEPFAGKNILLWGDLMQLPPPMASRIFKRHERFSAEIDLWRQFRFSELTINMRQGADPLGKICSELRVGKLSENSLRLLQSRLMYDEKGLNGNVESFKDAVRIFPQNGMCDAHNMRRTTELRRQLRSQGKLTYKIKAFDTYADGTKQGQLFLGELPKKDDLMGGIPTSIELGEGSRVMLRRNMNTMAGHVNGATGFVKKIEWTIDKNRQINVGDLPKRVLVKFDHEDADTWIEPVNVDFYAKKQQRVTRRALPLILSYALTVHKLQGATLDRAVIYLGPKCVTKGLAYVAISRVKTLSGLAIKEMDPRKLLTSNHFNPADTDALSELERLRATVSNDLNKENCFQCEIPIHTSYQTNPTTQNVGSILTELHALNINASQTSLLYPELNMFELI